MKYDYKGLIEKLRRTGQMYYPSNQSKLYFQAANAIESLLNKTNPIEKIKKIFRKEKFNGRN